MDKQSIIYVAGHKGMVGSAILRCLERQGFNRLIVADKNQLDLRNTERVNEFFKLNKPEYVFLAAAKVGGILANNTYPAEFLYENLMIEANVIHASHLNQVRKLLFLGSSCIYPKLADQPISEKSLLTGLLEPTNEAYAIAKIAGIKLCEAYRKQYGSDFISAMPTNLYGYNDNYHPENSHVLPALIQRFHHAKVKGSKSVTIWGSGKPLREFMFADDLAEACVFLMQSYSEVELVNVGTGEEISILELAEQIRDVVGFKGTIEFDSSKPDGTPRKLMDSSKIQSLGFMHKTSLSEGLKKTYQEYLEKFEQKELK
jgi:GDP-L-fucose synthase